MGTPKSNNWSGSLCQGLYPGGPNGQQYYVGDCYGHDEPSIQWYSTLPGSGGNISWNVTLPTDRAATQNQTDLYVAIWFGMALYDPYGLWHQCFLELQFYPDQTWYNPGPMFPTYTVNGAWIAAAVGWQIDAKTGAENPCFYQPLYLNGVPGPAFLNMTQGDTVHVTMQGWAGSTTGEQIYTNDTTNGQKSPITLFNATGNYPLDPAYAANSVPAGLEWGLGGQYPISFSYETGHQWNPTENVNGYGGCNPGLPGSSAATPCGTFDPGSWANDTATPWLIHAPVFFNGTQRQVGAQVGFEQDFGGLAQVDGLTSGSIPSCAGLDASAWCSYPWYSYSCTVNAYEFGATDYPGVTQDFGKYTQFHYRYQPSALGVGGSVVTNFTSPTCGGATATLNVMTSGGGSVDFLSNWMGSGTSAAGLAPGNYSVDAAAPPGMFFGSWTGSAGVVVADANTPWTSVDITGSGGTLTANFVASAVTSTVTLDDSGAAGQVSVTTYNFTFAPLISMGLTGTVATLPSGIYTIQAYPPVGYNFTYWSVTGATISAPGSSVSAGFPITWLIVTGGVPATVTAHYAASTALSHFTLVVFGPGTATLGPLTDTGGYNLGTGSDTYNYSTAALPVGHYSLTISAPGGWFFYSLLYAFPGIDLTDQHGIGKSSVTVQLTLEMSDSLNVFAADFLEVIFTEGITFSDNPAAGGTILGPTFTTLTSGTQISSPGPALYEGLMVAQPATGYVFSDWTNSTPLLRFYNNLDLNTAFLTGASGTITANYVAAAGATSLTFGVVNPAGGALTFNGGLVSNGQVNSSVATGGVYLASVTVNPGYTFGGFTTGGGATATIAPWNSGVEVTTASAGTLTATFTPSTVGISYVPSSGVTVTASVAGVTMSIDQRQLLVAQTSYPLSINLGGYGFEMWVPTSDITIADPTAQSTTFTATGSGTIYALVTPTPLVSGVTGVPNPTEVGVATVISTTLTGAGTYTYAWTALPPGCASTNSLTISCNPTTAGTYHSIVWLATPFGITYQSSPGTIVVDSALSASVAAAPTTIDLGQTTTFTASLSNGVTPVTDSWTGLPAGCPSANSISLPCTPTAAGASTIHFTGTDTLLVVATATVGLTVNPAVTASLAGSAASITLGASVTFTTTAGGGSATYTYSYAGLPAGTGCVSANSATITCTPSATGTSTVTVTATDGLGQSATSHVQLTVTATSSGGGGGNTFLGLPATEGYGLLAGIIILIVAVIIAAVMMSRRRGQTPPPTDSMNSTSPPTGPGSPPGSGGSS